MRIRQPDFTQQGLAPAEAGTKAKAGSDFLDALKDAVDSTNAIIRESEKAASDLSSGRSPNIHEAMIAMQKADVALKLLVTVTNKIIEGYNQLNRLG
jgi:flagellar hook-basal body complex protein FliE